MRSPCCLCLFTHPPINFWIPHLIYVKLCMYIMAPESISMAYSINPSRQLVCPHFYPLIVDRQQLGKDVTAATSTRATIELLDASFSMRFLSYQRKVGDYFFPALLVFIFLFRTAAPLMQRHECKFNICFLTSKSSLLRPEYGYLPRQYHNT
jgi:hypothetical protein